MIRLVAPAIMALLVMAGPSPVPATAEGAAVRPARVAASATGWQWPLAPPHPIVQAYEAPSNRYSAGHRGIDIAAASGSAVLAPVAGEVHFAGTVVDRPVLSIRHRDGLVSSYEPVTTALVAGDAVRQGDVVGEVSPAPSHCEQGCLHFGVRLHGEYVSPLKYLGGIPRSVLLPTRVVRQTR